MLPSTRGLEMKKKKNVQKCPQLTCQTTLQFPHLCARSPVMLLSVCAVKEGRITFGIVTLNFSDFISCLSMQSCWYPSTPFSKAFNILDLILSSTALLVIILCKGTGLTSTTKGFSGALTKSSSLQTFSLKIFHFFQTAHGAFLFPDDPSV